MFDALPAYAELHCLTNFTFLRGASHPEELAARAARLGYSALAITDECSLAGVVRAHVAAKEHGIKLIIGAEFLVQDPPHAAKLVCSRPTEMPTATCPGSSPPRGGAAKKAAITSPGPISNAV